MKWVWIYYATLKHLLLLRLQMFVLWKWTFNKITEGRGLNFLVSELGQDKGKTNSTPILALECIVAFYLDVNDNFVLLIAMLRGLYSTISRLPSPLTLVSFANLSYHIAHRALANHFWLHPKLVLVWHSIATPHIHGEFQVPLQR
jgi:hypothetical protein